jgi:cytochrome P450
VKARRRKGITTNSYGVPTIFDVLLDQSPQKPSLAPTEKELIDQGILLVASGTESTSYAISLGIFHILRNPEILGKMREELSKVKRDESGGFSHKDLAALPYLVRQTKDHSSQSIC